MAQGDVSNWALPMHFTADGVEIDGHLIQGRALYPEVGIDNIDDGLVEVTLRVRSDKITFSDDVPNNVHVNGAPATTWTTR